MALAIRAWVPVNSGWIDGFILYCDGSIGVMFGPAGGSKCVTYPGTAGGVGKNLFDVAAASPSPGQFLRRWLYKKLPWAPAPCPGPIGCGGGTQTGCCPAPINESLTLTCTGPITGSFGMTAYGFMETWKTGFIGDCGGGGGVMVIAQCVGTGWQFGLQGDNCGGGGVFVPNGSFSCSPLSVSAAIPIVAPTGSCVLCNGQTLDCTMTE